MKISCTHCQAVYEIDEAQLKQEVTKLPCKRCQKTFEVKKPATPAAVEFWDDAESAAVEIPDELSAVKVPPEAEESHSMFENLDSPDPAPKEDGFGDAPGALMSKDKSRPVGPDPLAQAEKSANDPGSAMWDQMQAMENQGPSLDDDTEDNRLLASLEEAKQEALGITEPSEADTPSEPITKKIEAPEPPPQSPQEQVQPPAQEEGGIMLESALDTVQSHSGIEFQSPPSSIETESAPSSQDVLGNAPPPPTSPEAPPENQAPAPPPVEPSAPAEAPPPPPEPPAPAAKPTPPAPSAEQVAASQAPTLIKPKKKKMAKRKKPMAQQPHAKAPSDEESLLDGVQVIPAPQPPPESKAQKMKKWIGVSLATVGVMLIVSMGMMLLFKKDDEPVPSALDDFSSQDRHDSVVTTESAPERQEALTAQQRSAKTAAAINKDKPTPEPVVEESEKSAFELGVEAFQEHSLESYKRSRKHLVAAYKEDSKSSPTRLALSEVYSVLGHDLKKASMVEKGFKLAKSVADSKEEPAWSQRALARAYYYGGHYQDAMQAGLKAVRLEDESADAYYLLGISMVKLGKGAGALQKAHKRDAKYLPALVSLADYYQSIKKPKKSLYYARRLIKAHPERVEGYQFSIDAAMDLKKYQTAFNYAEQAILTAPDDIDINLKRAELLLLTGEAGEAVDSVVRLLKARKRLGKSLLVDAYMILGKGYIRLNRYDKAGFYLSKLLRLDARNVTALNYLGLCHFKNKNYAKALKTYRRSYEIRPSHTIRYNMAQVEIELGSYDLAEEDLRAVLAKQKNHADAYVGLGIIAEARGKKATAKKYYKKALRLKPANKEARRRLAALN